MPVIPILSVLACLWLALNLSIETWLRFLVDGDRPGHLLRVRPPQPVLRDASAASSASVSDRRGSGGRLGKAWADPYLHLRAP